MRGNLNTLSAQQFADFAKLRPSDGQFAAEAGRDDRNWQLLRITSTTPNADGTLDGYWVVTTNGTPADQQVIRVKPVSGNTSALGLGYFYLGYFSHYDETNHVGVFCVPDGILRSFAEISSTGQDDVEAEVESTLNLESDGFIQIRTVAATKTVTIRLNPDCLDNYLVTDVTWDTDTCTMTKTRVKVRDLLGGAL